MVQKRDVFIGKIADSSSLYQDFLKFHSSIFDMEKKTLTLNQSIIPITKIKTREKLWVKLTKDTTRHPHIGQDHTKVENVHNLSHGVHSYAKIW